MHGIFRRIGGFGCDPSVHAKNPPPVKRAREVNLHNGFGGARRAWRNAGARTVGGRNQIPRQGSLLTISLYEAAALTSDG